MGRAPRNFALDTTGRFLLVGNQGTDTIAVFAIADACLFYIQLIFLRPCVYNS